MRVVGGRTLLEVNSTLLFTSLSIRTTTTKNVDE